MANRWHKLLSGTGGGTSAISAGPASSTDNAIVRWDGVAGNDIQDSGVTISDANVVSGATQLNVDNIRVDGNTISSTDTNGDVQIAPNGTGNLDVNGCNIELNASGTDIDVVLSTISRAGYGEGTLKLYSRDGVSQGHLEAGSAWINGHNSGVGVELRNGYYLAWASSLGSEPIDAGIGRTATNTLSVRSSYNLANTGKLLTARVVEAHTADDTLLTTETFSIHTNSGASGEVIFTLPTAAARLLRYGCTTTSSQGKYWRRDSTWDYWCFSFGWLCSKCHCWRSYSDRKPGCHELVL